MILKNTFRCRAAALLAMFAALSFSASAQQRGGTGGGGFGGGNFGGGNFGSTRTGGSTSSSGSSTGSSRDYPNNTLPGDATFGIDPETRSLVVMTDEATHSNIMNLVAMLDRPKPQVLIKVVFLEVTHNDDLDFGIDGSFSHNYNPASGITNVNLQNIFGPAGLQNLGTTPSTIGPNTLPAGAGLYQVLGTDFTATMRAIAAAGKVEVLSRPSILVRNNQPATITVGQSVPLVTGVVINGLTGSPTSTITYQNVGIILQVTPFISANGMVEMIVSPQISSLSATSVPISSGTNFNVNAPAIDIRSASTVVVSPDGQTVIIGGLMEDSKTTIDSKIPILGDIPLLGALFKHKQSDVTKKELMIFLTPHVVTIPAQFANVSATMGDMSRKAFSEQQMDKYFDRVPAKSKLKTTTTAPVPQGFSDPNQLINSNTNTPPPLK